jgi:CelD/BcsL family acetyltransferase involved in cellulose biosynthesis
VLRKRHRTVEFIGSPNIDYAGILAEDPYKIALEIVKFFKFRWRKWNQLKLREIPEGPMYLALTNAGRKVNLKGLSYACDKCFAWEYQGNENLQNQFTLKRNKSLKNCISFFSKLPGYEFKIIYDTAEIYSLLPTFFDYHTKRWKTKNKNIKFIDQKNVEFYNKLVCELGKYNQICIIGIFEQNRPIAMAFCFIMNKHCYIYTLAHNHLYDNKSPGKVLGYILTVELVRAGYKVDFTRGDHLYKRSFSNTIKLNYMVHYWKNPIMFHGYKSLKSAVKIVKKVASKFEKA